MNIRSLIVLLVVIGLGNIQNVVASMPMKPGYNPYYLRKYTSGVTNKFSNKYRNYYDYYDPYVRRSSPVPNAISDYDYYSTPYSYYYY